MSAIRDNCFQLFMDWIRTTYSPLLLVYLATIQWNITFLLFVIFIYKEEDYE